MTRNNKGFTLIEIIVIIVVGGIVAAMLVPFMGSALTRSHEPLVNLEKAASVSSDMARVVAKVREASSNNIACDDLISDIENIDGIEEKSELNTRIGCFIEEDSGKYSFENEAACDLENDPIYLLEVRLNHHINPGETATFLFPCK